MKIVKEFLIELAAALVFGAVVTAIVWFGIETSPLYG